MTTKASNWLPVVLGDYIKVTSGFAFKSNQFADTGSIPIARIRDVKRGFSETYYTGNYDEKYLIDNGDLLIGMDGEFNAALWSGGQALLNQRVCRINSLKTLDFDFLRFLLPIELKKIEDRTPFVTVKHISTEQIRRIEFLLPPLEEQRRIAVILDKADAVRRKRQSAIALTEELLRSAFLEMFGDPVTNPKGWKKVKFQEIFEEIKYGTSTPPIFEDEGIPFIRATNIKKGTVTTNDLKFISLTEAQKIEKCKLKRGDIVIVRSGVNSGDSALITEEYENAYAGYDMIISIKPALSIFYNYLINDDSGKQLIKPLTRRAAQPHINADQIRNLDFILPPQSTINNFNNFFNCTHSQKQVLCISLKHLDNFFNSLLHRAFRGEL